MNSIFRLGIVFCILGREPISSLRLSKPISVPSIKYRGENALLECPYELNNRSINNKLNAGYDNANSRQHNRRNNYLYYDNDEEMEETLYSVKWYKDEEEFYRYVPRANPPQNSYSFDGIKVDHKRSNSRKVFLRSITLKSSGLYRCEVSLEGPSFSSVQGEGYMLVVYIPKDGPYISGEEVAYQSGDKLNLTCSSGRSHPASKLQFFINNDPITNPKYIIHYPDAPHNHGLISTSIGLNMRIMPQYFERNTMTIKCVASISPVIWSGRKETTIVQQGLISNQFDIPPPSIDTREAMFLVKSSAITIKSTSIYLLAIAILNFIYR